MMAQQQYTLTMALNPSRDARQQQSSMTVSVMAFDSDEEEVGGTNEVQYTEAKEPTKVEGVEQLRKPGVVGTVEAKRRPLCDVIAMIHDDLWLTFTTVSRSIAESFAIVIADAQEEVKKKKGGAAKLADIIYELGIIFRTHSIAHSMQVEHGGQRKTRSGETVLGMEPYQSVLDSLKDAIDVVSYVKLAQAKSCIVKLSQEEKRQTYLSRGRKPLDETMRRARRGPTTVHPTYAGLDNVPCMNIFISVKLANHRLRDD
eukprot:scaffold27746_cov71-Attheya_sp.AAC.1